MIEQRITKFEIAERQLLVAIEMFIARNPIPALTLAGAAEEILGKLVKKLGGTNALEEDINDSCELSETVFGDRGNSKEFADLMNAPRNELKHLMSGEAIEFDLEEAAINLISRAIINFEKLRPGPNVAFQNFETQASAWYRLKQVRNS
ncbi:hypothetical protein [Methylomonas rosea]|uniref:Uncharacterized protein n=1 Tax=Methylomonas rosea TaxID=2952227 RepID=A0ABT1TTW2_9GAMM|nr:hypothetical protein [Methylomonas sp. WSC-7]MCQ8117781.1 hypothetical protein [Methylomonas sp. WSC-7]